MIIISAFLSVQAVNGLWPHAVTLENMTYLILKAYNVWSHANSPPVEFGGYMKAVSCVTKLLTVVILLHVFRKVKHIIYIWRYNKADLYDLPGDIGIHKWDSAEERGASGSHD